MPKWISKPTKAGIYLRRAKFLNCLSAPDLLLVVKSAGRLSTCVGPVESLSESIWYGPIPPPTKKECAKC